MKHFVNRGHTIQLNWTLHSISGQEFALTGHTYKLFFSTGNQSAQATGVTHSGNVLSWTFTPDAQWKLGSYTIWLEVYNNGTKIVTVAYPDAFHLVHEVASSGTTQTGTQTESTTLNLVSSCDFYRFAPVIPVAGDDGYWYVNGVKAVDGNGEYILTSHTLEYDETTKNLIIDKDRVDSEGNSIEQVITALADLDTSYQVAEGSSAGSVAGDGSRWGAYKTAEAARDAARETAEGTPLSQAGGNTRWGKYKSAEAARETASQTAEGSEDGSVAGDGSRWGAFKTAEAARNLAFQQSASAATTAAGSANTAAQRANSAAQAAERMVEIQRGPAGVSPIVGNNGNWWTWDSDEADYVDTNLPARGINGVGFDSTSNPTPPDGTASFILSNGDEIVFDFNHEHPGYCSKGAESLFPMTGFLPDVVYKLGTITEDVSFSLAPVVLGNTNHYFWTFETGSVAPTITWPNGITWADGTGPAVSANKHYEISILDGIAVFLEV